MAIIIEEEKKRFNIFTLATVITVAAVAAVAVYYLFFSEVPFIEKVIPSNLQTIKTISADKFKPDDLLSNSLFKTLKQNINPIDQPNPQKRLNPFRPFSPQIK